MNIVIIPLGGIHEPHGQQIVNDRIGLLPNRTDTESTDSYRFCRIYRFLPILTDIYRYLPILLILTDSVESVRIGKNR